jgi:hypothetical protein
VNQYAELLGRLRWALAPRPFCKVSSPPAGLAMR